MAWFMAICDGCSKWRSCVLFLFVPSEPDEGGIALCFFCQKEAEREGEKARREFGI